MAQNGPEIIVIGAGILGASAAYALQRAGAQVTMVDGGGPKATFASFGWINASFYHDASHFALRTEGIAAWHRLTSKLGLPVAWQGTLCWEETGAALDAQRDRLLALGYDVEDVSTDQFRRLEPQIATPPDRALAFRQEAAAESGAVTQQLIAAALVAGCRILHGLNVSHLVEQNGRVAGIRTQAGVTYADHVVLAAGTGTSALMAQVGCPLPMLSRPALVLRTRPVAPVLNHVVVSELGELRQLPDGTLLMPAAIDHQGDTAEAVPKDLGATAAAVLTRLRALLPSVAIDWQALTLAHRPVPKDQLPVLGAVQKGLYVACMHSGITLGALAGEIVAQEVLGGVTNQTAALLAPYRPGRFEG